MSREKTDAQTLTSALTCFYSGTGNSHRVARFVHERCTQRGLDSALCSVEQSHPANDLHEGSDQLFNLVFPTHGFCAPWHMIKTVLRLPRGQGKPALVVATRAGFVVGSWHPPGLAGIGPFLISLVLLLKGYRPRGCASVNMPSNWYSLHPMQKATSHQRIISRARQIIVPVLDRVLDGRRVWWTFNNLYELSTGLPLAPLSLGYLLAGRFFLAKLFFASSRCTHCGLCMRSCPTQSIRMWGTPPRPYWRYNCESCMRCAGFCPTQAIEAGHSWGVALYFITGIPISTLVLRWFGEDLGLPTWLGQGIPASLLNLLYAFPALMVSYAGFWCLLRLRWVNWLFARTTLTHYWGRYRESGTRLTMLRGVRHRQKPPVDH